MKSLGRRCGRANLRDESPVLSIDNVDLLAACAAQVQDQTIGGNICRNEPHSGRERELGGSVCGLSMTAAGEMRNEADHENAQRDDDQNAQQDYGREQAAIGCGGFRGERWRLYADTGQI